MPVKNISQFMVYGVSTALILVAIRLLEVRFIIFSNSFEIYAGGIAVIFTCLGIWLALKLSKPKIQTQIIEKEIFIDREQFIFNEQAFGELKLSKRELEVLNLMANGLSNQQIADQLFVSLNTVKTHISRLFEKLDVKRRTQAIEVAKKISLIP